MERGYTFRKLVEALRKELAGEEGWRSSGEDLDELERRSPRSAQGLRICETLCLGQRGYSRVMWTITDSLEPSMKLYPHQTTTGVDSIIVDENP